ncbi:UNVERIFIED_ORG: hypothetical protein LHK14_13245 [Roseateles sp. XES5]|nr:hypothetical protein [Roseateles sp. XES5]
MKKNQNRRLASDGRYFPMFEWFMRSAAWHHASVYEKALYVEIKRRYDGKNNGDIPMSHREAAGLLGCSNKPIAAAFAGLQEKGFLKASIKGSFDWKVAKAGKNFGRCTRWELTELPRDLPTRVLSGGSKDFMRWTPGENLAVCLAVEPQEVVVGHADPADGRL